MADLKPCPFCGSVDLTMVHLEDEYYIGCYTCETCGPSSPDKSTAKENWNRRYGGKENAVD